MAPSSIEVKVISCKGLKAFNFFQKLSIYSTISILNTTEKDPTKQTRTQLQKTPIDKQGNGNPEWNHQVQFNFKQISSFESILDYLFLEFDFVCESQLLVFGDKTIGRVLVPIKELIEDKFNGVARFVSYQVVTIDNGKPNGVLDFSYKVIDYQIGNFGYPVVEEVVVPEIQINPFQHLVYPSQPPPPPQTVGMPGVYYPIQEVAVETCHFPQAEMVYYPPPQPSVYPLVPATSYGAAMGGSDYNYSMCHYPAVPTTLYGNAMGDYNYDCSTCQYPTVDAYPYPPYDNTAWRNDLHSRGGGYGSWNVR
ncbi:hypothetical protein FRX31_002195 [Thalictrum thalictroides]|uniref:C2 domain-containing protein n=1 Tax=Thalictrum thalictroides TaxID=46969 RepID=A0A7J6XHP7_THATH|nr:hypothetical protein FRX31_002195 [Thalictrum thalictroides]